MSPRLKIHLGCLLIWVSLIGSLTALCSQEPELPQYLIKDDGSGCEIFAVYLLELKERLAQKDERIFVIAQLGNGETTDQINRARLNQIKAWFEGLGLKTEKLILASGERVQGQGRIKMYVGNQFYLLGIAPKNAVLCVGERCEAGCKKPIKLRPRK
jgi:hypothetical protein